MSEKKQELQVAAFGKRHCYRPYTFRKIVYGGVIAWIEADEQ